MEEPLNESHAPDRTRARLYAAAALAVWAALTFGHKLGLQVAAAFFAWAREPGTLSREGGQAGMRVAERGLAVFFAAVAILVLARVAFALRGRSRAEALEALVPWVAWAAILYGVWKTYIVYATELVHFGQYALVGFLVAKALDGGRRPAAAFLLTVGLAALDEVWQHYVLAWGDPYHWMDWSDIVLDALGATAGILPLVTLARLEGRALPDTRATTWRVVLGAAALTLPLLLLPPQATTRLLGHYRHHPHWGEYTNDKPTHWPGPREGVPLVLGVVLVLATLLEPGRAALSQRGVMVLALLWAVSIDPPSRKKGTPVREDVPRTVARRATTPIVVDGRLDEPAWATAERLGPFRLNRSGAPSPSGQETYARVLWDDQRIYFAFEVQDRDVWARDTHRDDVWLPNDEVVEVFLDDGGDEVTYYEVEVSPANVVYDLFCFVASAPVDFNPDMPVMGLPQWDARPNPSLGGLGLETAVHVRGTLDLVASGQLPVVPADEDEGYTVEIALPWSALWVTSRPTEPHRPVPPRVGDRWRLGLYRIERPRPRPLPEGAPATLDRAEALARLGVEPARLDALVKGGDLKVDAEGRFDAARINVRAAMERAEHQAWSPTWDPGDSFHRPQFFGVLEFGE
ncbi:MAG: VanZ family protein [Planctomycetes bacterium]|nr:VanZ family protein [Planctomycetota bacterium]